MYELFSEECRENEIPQEEIPKKWLYADIFNTEFNLSFKEPNNDTCDTCDEFIIKLKENLPNETQHKYLLRGHTHMEVDSVHARIERQMKASPDFSIITPWDWQQLMRLCNSNFKVREMQTLDFKNFNY
ncbi:hypothetical protein NQ315_012227, partial [Exocentrus adspersus]